MATEATSLKNGLLTFLTALIGYFIQRKPTEPVKAEQELHRITQGNETASADPRAFKQKEPNVFGGEMRIKGMPASLQNNTEAKETPTRSSFAIDEAGVLWQSFTDSKTGTTSYGTDFEDYVPARIMHDKSSMKTSITGKNISLLEKEFKKSPSDPTRFRGIIFTDKGEAYEWEHSYKLKKIEVKQMPKTSIVGADYSLLLNTNLSRWDTTPIPLPNGKILLNPRESVHDDALGVTFTKGYVGVIKIRYDKAGEPSFSLLGNTVSSTVKLEGTDVQNFPRYLTQGQGSDFRIQPARTNISINDETLKEGSSLIIEGIRYRMEKPRGTSYMLLRAEAMDDATPGPRNVRIEDTEQSLQVQEKHKATLTRINASDTSIRQEKTLEKIRKPLQALADPANERETPAGTLRILRDGTLWQKRGQEHAYAGWICNTKPGQIINHGNIRANSIAQIRPEDAERALNGAGEGTVITDNGGNTWKYIKEGDNVLHRESINLTFFKP